MFVWKYSYCTVFSSSLEQASSRFLISLPLTSSACPFHVCFLCTFALTRRRSAQWDIILMFLGSVCAVGAGIVMPVFSIIFGDIIDAFHGPQPFFEVRGKLN